MLQLLFKPDSQGAVGMAITDYQNASETLLKLIRLYPTSSVNKIYKTSYQKYQERIKALKETRGDIEPVVDPNASPEDKKNHWHELNLTKMMVTLKI